MQILRKPFKIEIDPFIFPVSLITFYYGCLTEYFTIFISMTIHEMAHIAAALSKARKLRSVKVLSIGLNAVIEVNPVRDNSSFFINISGPLINILLSTVCYILGSYYLTLSDNMRFFIYANISLAIFNMLPILPLDGGRILKDILVSKIGLFSANRYSKRISWAFAFLLMILGIFQFLSNIYNFSIIFIAGYILFFLKHEETEVSLMNIKNLVYKRSRFLKRGIYPGRELVVIKSMRLGDIIKSMDFDRFHIIYVLDEDMKLIKIFTEQEVIDYMIKYNAEMSFDELIRSLA